MYGHPAAVRHSMKNLEKSVEKTPLRPLNAKARHN